MGMRDLARRAAKAADALLAPAPENLPVSPGDCDSVAALWAAEHTPLTRQDGERDTELVKRIVAAYLNGCHVIGCKPLRVYRPRQ